MYQVVCMGEMLIDFTPAGTSANGYPIFEQNPGGAPANLSVCLSRLGINTGFIGKVGDDQFGRFLQNVLKENNVSTAGLVLAPLVNTTLAFVHLGPDGERSFTFNRNPGADTTLRPSEVRLELLKSEIFHFGSLSLTNEPARSATHFALNQAKKNGALISYDPNLRPQLWKNLEEARHRILEVMGDVDLLKMSLDEFAFLTNTNDLKAGSKSLVANYDLDALFITLGNKGCFYRVGELTNLVQGFSITPIDSTGAGDAFLGGILYKLIQAKSKIKDFSQKQLEECVRFANALGALATTKKGAIPAMPTYETVKAFMREERI